MFISPGRMSLAAGNLKSSRSASSSANRIIVRTSASLDRFDRGQVLGVAQDDLGDPDLAGLRDRVAEKRVGAVGALARLQVVGRLEIALVDLLGIDEVEDVDRLGLLEGGGLEVVLREDDELPLLVLVALDEILPADRFAFGLADAFVAAPATRPWRAAA